MKIFYAIRMSFACHLYVTCMYSYVIRMSLGFTRMSSVCHSYALVCHLYVLVWTLLSSVCHSHVVLSWTSKKVKFLHDTVYLLLSFQGEYIMLPEFILIATNHRKNDYYVIYHPNICKIVYSWFCSHVA